MEDAGIFIAIWTILWPIDIFYGYLVDLAVNWYILWSFGIFYGHFFRFWNAVPKKSGNPDRKVRSNLLPQVVWQYFATRRNDDVTRWTMTYVHAYIHTS
jgi:hypothetical protein